jgi:hypothetical protein
MGSPQVCSGASLQCSFGAAPGTLMVLPMNRVMVGGMPAANLMDYVPIVNVAPFGTCMSMANPMVIAATAAALGVLTPMPCISMAVAPWIPSGAPTVLVGPYACAQCERCLDVYLGRGHQNCDAGANAGFGALMGLCTEGAIRCAFMRQAATIRGLKKFNLPYAYQSPIQPAYS